jgi:hypothetical protein
MSEMLGRKPIRILTVDHLLHRRCVPRHDDVGQQG